MVTSTIKTNEDIAVRVLSLLHDIAEVVPEYLEKDIDNFLLFVTQLYAEKSLEDDILFIVQFTIFIYLILL